MSRPKEEHGNGVEEAVAIGFRMLDRELTVAVVAGGVVATVKVSGNVFV